MYANTYNLSIWFYKKNYKNFSHTMCLNTNETPTYVSKWNEYTMFMLLDLQRNAQKYQWLHQSKWVWFEPIYSWGRKLVVISFLVITGLLLLWIWLATLCYHYVQNFEFLHTWYAAFMNLVSHFHSREFLPITGLLLCNIQLAALLQYRLQWIIFQNYNFTPKLSITILWPKMLWIVLNRSNFRISK